MRRHVDVAARPVCLAARACNPEQTLLFDRVIGWVLHHQVSRVGGFGWRQSSINGLFFEPRPSWQTLIKHVLATCPVEALNESILIGFAEFDMLSVHTIRLAPLFEYLTKTPRASVGANDHP